MSSLMENIMNILNILNHNKIKVLFSVSVGILLLFIITSVCISLIIVVSYYSIKTLNIKYINSHGILKDYNSCSKYYLNKYGNCPITGIYLVQQPLWIFLDIIIKILWNMQRNYRHNLLLFEIQLPDMSKKIISVSKEVGIHITPNYTMCESHRMISIPINSLKTKTINSILKKTKLTMGKKLYFNWHIYTNNCETFTRNVLRNMNVYTKHVKKFICQKIESNASNELSLYFIGSYINLLSSIYQIS